MFVNPFRSDLVAGYRQISKSRQTLLGKWRFKLLRAYTKRWDKYAQQLARQQVNLARFNRYVPWIGGGLLVLWLGGGWVTFGLDANYGAQLLSAAFSATIAALMVWVGFNLRPTPPENPLAQYSKNKRTTLLKQKLFPELMPRWREQMSMRIPWEFEVERMVNQNRIFGRIGEYNLIRALAGVVSPDTVILHSLMPKPKDDMDVVLIGPKGIWYFEVKYINAEVLWHDGVWEIWKIGDRRTGELVKVEMKEYPDAQWYRMRAEATGNLKTNLGDSLSKNPALGKIKGGVVFAHPNVSIQIQKSPTFVYGKVGAWVNALQAAPLVPGITPEVIFQLTDILLKRHQALNPGQAVTSMSAYSARLIQKSEREIQEWIDKS